LGENVPPDILSPVRGTRRPNHLLARLDPHRFAAPWERAKDSAADPQATAQAAFPAMLDRLTDLAAD